MWQKRGEGMDAETVKWRLGVTRNSRAGIAPGSRIFSHEEVIEGEEIPGLYI